MILVLNCGSQSIKWKLLSKKLKLVKENKIKIFDAKKYQQVLEKELKNLSNENIDLIGHRVVFGGEKFGKPTRITPKTVKELEKFNKIVPSHNPFNLLGIKKSLELFGTANQFAVFDTEFYSSLPACAYTYSLPSAITKKFGYRKFGFHGISHEYVAKKAAEKIGKPFDNLRIITCHLGGGASVTAIKNGKAIDTSMGFGPTEGLIMMTRSGDVDNEIILEMAKKYGTEKTRKIINFESGFKGICGLDDMLLVLDKIKRGDKNTKLALDIFTYQIKKYIGAYFAILGGCDILVFTGSIGSGNPKTRNAVCKGLDIFKKTKVIAIETDEELAIAEKITKKLKELLP